jgi:hypothetical protein
MNLTLISDSDYQQFLIFYKGLSLEEKVKVASQMIDQHTEHEIKNHPRLLKFLSADKKVLAIIFR